MNLETVKNYGKVFVKGLDPRTGYQHIKSPYKRWAHYILWGASVTALSTLIYLPISTAIIAVLCTWLAYIAYLFLVLTTEDRAELALGGINDFMKLFDSTEKTVKIEEVYNGVSE